MIIEKIKLLAEFYISTTNFEETNSDYSLCAHGEVMWIQYKDKNILVFGTRKDNLRSPDVMNNSYISMSGRNIESNQLSVSNERKIVQEMNLNEVRELDINDQAKLFQLSTLYDSDTFDIILKYNKWYNLLIELFDSIPKITYIILEFNYIDVLDKILDSIIEKYGLTHAK